MQGTFLLLQLLTRVAFKLDASYSLIVASCVMDLGLEVETFREARYGCSSLGGRVRVDRIGRDCVHVHGNIASSRAWVHDMVIHHSW